MTHEQLMDILRDVYRMRKAQKEYFASSNASSALRAIRVKTAKECERKVDAMLDELIDRINQQNEG